MAAMDRSLTCTLFLLGLSATLGKYVYIKGRMNLYQAWQHCNRYHTDLAPITNEHDIRRLWRITRNTSEFIWIGLVRSRTDREKWIWSGGAGVSTFFWAPDQPNNTPGQDYGVMFEYRWHDAKPHYRFPVFCYSVVVVRERKTWQGALDHCREHHHDLASVASETEMLLIKKELDKDQTTDHMWFGLRFFPGEWLWVDGQPLSYELWSREGRPVCPVFRRQCAAIQVTQRQENNSAITPLPTTDADRDVHMLSMAFIWDTAIGGSDAVVNEVWKAHNCEERFHFICQRV